MKISQDVFSALGERGLALLELRPESFALLYTGVEKARDT